MVQLSGHWVKKKSKNIVHAFWENLAQKSDRHGCISDLASKSFIYLGWFFVFNFFFNFTYLFLKVFIESVAVLLLFYVLSFWPQGTQDLSSPIRDQTRYWKVRSYPMDCQGNPFRFHWNAVGWQCCGSFRCTAMWFRICILFFTFTSIAGYNKIFGRVGLVLWVRKSHTGAK